VQTAEYPISANYCAKWSIVEGIREIISNAMDTKLEFTTGWDNGYGYVHDNGNGFPKECLILGEGESKDDTQIGQFREGLKIAGLVFARERRFFRGKTVGYTFNFRMAQSTTFDCETLFMDFEQNEQEKGTIVTFECTEAEIDIAKALFLKDERDTAFIVPDRPGELFINKSFVHKIDKALYGYNIADKNAANRDRSILNMDNVKDSIQKIWNTIEGERFIKTYLKSTEQFIEHEITISVNPKCKHIWHEELEKIYGSKYCVFDDEQYAHQVADWGYRVIKPLTYSMKSTLNYYLDVPMCRDILENHIKKEYTDFTPNLSPHQLKIYNLALDMAYLYYEEPLNIMVVEKISFLEEDDSRAMADRDNNRILITPKAIDRGLKKLIGSIIHEQTHLTKGHNDSSRAFEDDLTEVIGDLLVKMNKQMLIGERDPI